MSGLGDELRAAREARRLSLTDVSEQIHIRSVYLQALEEENWTAISAPVYVRGFLRTYARFLGLDSEAAVDRFTTLTGAPRGNPAAAPAIPAAPVPQASVAPSVVPQAPKMRRDAQPSRESGDRKGPSALVLFAAAVALALVVFVGYKFVQYQNGSQDAGGSAAVAVASPQPSTAPTHAPTAAPTKAPDRTLAVRVTQYSWVEVDVDGKPAVSGNFQKGWTKEFHGDTATVNAGNAGGVDVEVNGREQGPMGNAGDVVTKQFVLGTGDKRGRG